MGNLLSDEVCAEQRFRLRLGPGLHLAHVIYGGYEAVTALGDRFDVFQASVPLSQCFSQDEDVLVKVSLLDKGVGPHPFHQFVFINQVSRVLNEQ